jgi:hypothetical protein
MDLKLRPPCLPHPSHGDLKALVAPDRVGRRPCAKTEFQNAGRRLILSRFPFFKQSGYRRSNSVNGIWLAQESADSRAPSFLFAVIS